jgi:CheY-like chemotaxis protein
MRQDEMSENKLLVVDDEIHIRALLEQTLEDLSDDYGVEVFSAANGQEALAVIREEIGRASCRERVS